MSDTIYADIQTIAEALGLELEASELAGIASDRNMSDVELETVRWILTHLSKKKHEKMVATLLRLSRLPLKEPKTFENFDFSQLRGDNQEELQNLPTLSALYAKRNLAFIGPHGVGKTHLAMAYGRKCCMNGLKSYFIKAVDLNQRLSEARQMGKERSFINMLVKPSCLIIDEVGHSRFDLENTRMFFDIVDRRYGKDCPNTTIFTSNIQPDKWGDYFSEESTLLCALDRIFDCATVYVIKGNSYRGKKLERVSLTAGSPAVTIK